MLTANSAVETPAAPLTSKPIAPGNAVLLTTATSDELPRIVILRTADGTEFAVPTAQIVPLSSIVVDRLESTKTDTTENEGSGQGEECVPVVSVPHVSPYILSKVLECVSTCGPFQTTSISLCDDPAMQEIPKTPANLYAFMRSLTNQELVQVALASQVLDLQPLLLAAGERIAEEVNNSSVGSQEDIMKAFDVDGLEATASAEAPVSVEESAAQEQDCTMEEWVDLACMPAAPLAPAAEPESADMCLDK